jgi:protein-disulfide isomerase
MDSSEQVKKIFLLGSIVLGALIVVGLIWAVSTSPGGSPKPGSYTFNDDNDPSFGPGEAKLVVRVFGDFQCPACRAAEPGFKYAKDTYGDKVRFVWNDFPLQSVHANALPAAIAARCAESQNKFWEYHDKLYSDQSDWSSLASPAEKFVAYAEYLGLNKDTFAACFAEKQFQNKITDDVREGDRNGVNSTPTFFIGDSKFVSALERDVWDKEIQSRLTTK